MPTVLLERIETEARRLSRDEQLELARRLLNQALTASADEKQFDLTDLIGIGHGTWRSADEVNRYLEEERNSWER